ncbi:MAG TPA: CRTAC1 family protein [Candidatus Sulfotelmatobacter sp.]|nr:CRTAC1 family protein [Candidatus Sulfotelmatobacter sp.]
MSSRSSNEWLHNSVRNMGWVALLVSTSLATVAQAPDVQFTDITAQSHIDFTQENSATSNKYLIETMGGGVAVFDYDNDGRLDIFFTSGALISDPMPDGKMPDKSNKKFWNRLYHQNADGTFTDVTEHAGLTGMPQGYYSMGVAVGDFDNDGFEDLYLTGYGGNILYHNNGDGTFKDVTEKAGVKGGNWSASAGFFDYDNDGKLDLFVTRYVDWTFKTNRYCGERPPNGVRSYCHPDNYDGLTNILYHNNGDGTFTDVSQKAGIANPHGKGLGVSFSDYDGDGFTDIFVANDSVQCFLYHNNGNGTFAEVGLLAGVGYNEDGKTFAGMGIDFSDYDNDGLPDIVVTDLSNERYMMFRNEGTGTFRDVTNTSGIGGATLAFSGWSTHLFDYDNDGWKDLFVAQSHVMDTIEKTSPNLRYLEPPLLLRNSSGHFSRVIPGDAFRQDWAGRGAAFGDIDNDGDVDVVVSNLGQKSYVLRNDGGNRNNWIGIQTVGTKSNRDGIGARIKVVSASGLTQYFTVNTAVGYLSASDKRVIAGLGKDSSAKLIEIRWPSGIVQKFEDVKARQYLKAVEPTQ